MDCVALGLPFWLWFQLALPLEKHMLADLTSSRYQRPDNEGFAKMGDRVPKLQQEDTDVFLAFQVIPRVRNGNNFEIVDKAIDVVKKANVPFQVGAMETTMKGDLDQLLNIVKEAQQTCLDHGAVEVITNIKIHTTTPDAHDTFCTYDRGVTPSNSMFVKADAPSR